jgi:hypothetical protein
MKDDGWLAGANRPPYPPWQCSSPIYGPMAESFVINSLLDEPLSRLALLSDPHEVTSPRGIFQFFIYFS